MIDNALWEYSLTVYQNPVVRDSCLLLQDKHGADVNVLLLACWLGRRGVCWNPRQLEVVTRLSERFASEYLQSFRDLRRRLKEEAPQSIYIEARRFELSLERWQQDVIYSYWLEQPQEGLDRPFAETALENCRQYFRHKGDPARKARDKLLETLVAGVEQAHREYGL